MRARNIKPGFFKNEDVAECSIPARLLEVGCWTLCDRQGRMENRPRRIKMEIYPGDAIDVGPLLDELVAHGRIRIYGGEDGKSFIWFPNFKRHQKFHLDEKDSVIPPHPEDPEPNTGLARVKKDVPPKNQGGGTVETSCEQGASTVQGGEKGGVNTVAARPEYRIPNTECGMRNAEDRKPKAEGARPAPVSVSAVLPQLGLKTPESAKRALLDRIMALGDGPDYEPWWTVVINRMERSEGLGVLLAAVDKAEGCKDPAVRAAKGMGELDRPSAYVGSVCREHLKAHGKTLPRPPGPSGRPPYGGAPLGSGVQ
jgi:translation initiation factor IF-1